jgi:hypothetical protein
MILFIFARYGEDWSFLKMKSDEKIVKWHWQALISDVKLIDILWLSLLYPLSAIGKLILRNKKNWIYSRYVKIYDSISEKYKGCVEYFKKETPPYEKGFFEEDVPLKDTKEKSNGSDDDDDEPKFKDTEKENAPTDDESQQYKELTDVLVPKLVDQKFQKAFSIGIIGPYGNGKSSFVNHLRDEFENQLSSKRFEVIEFLPAYSHKPEQIITDFFTVLASKLKKYHGSLNQSMLAYAAKLIELGVNGKKDIQGLLKPTDWFTENKSASQAYNELKKIIEKIDIKTIVIIDDVDRLGKDEIFEVLRIIRNTANFPNTIFIVAYDKDYVIKMIDQDLMYLDKYFQYELFVPPHRGEDLLKAFSEMVLHNEMGLGAEQLEKLKEVIKVETLNKTLLDRFVLNYRDVKVLTNIYCATIRLLKEEVDYGDLLHFTLMNRYFPKQVRYIYNNSDELFDPINSTKKKLEFKKRDFLKKPITVDSFIADLNIEEDSQKKLFKRLFIVLFGIKDDTKEEKCPEPLTEYEKLLGYTESAVKSLRTSDLELSIRNVERTYIYFEIFLRDDDISNINFGDKIGTDDFKAYIAEFLSPLSGLKRKGIEKEIENKLKDIDKSISSEIKIDNVIWACHKVRGAYLESNLIDVLGTNMIVNYPNALADIFGGDNDVFAAFFKKNLWDKDEIDLPYKIVAILELSKDVEAISSNDVPRYEGKPVYFGSSKVQIKKILISKLEEFIQADRIINIHYLNLIAKVLDSPLDVTDSEIGFSKYLYDNKDRLFDYLRAVEYNYKEGFDFSAAIFKVFTDINKFETECFGLDEHRILIREFHHLLELHDIRKGVVNLSEFIPFYFSANKGHNTNGQYQSIYLKKEPRLEEWNSPEGANPSKTFVVCAGVDSIDIIEGKLSYQTLMSRFTPTAKQTNLAEFLKSSDDVEIISIQTPEQVNPSIIPNSKFNKMIAEEKAKSNQAELVN